MGGTEQVINQLASGAARFGIETTVLSLTRERRATTAMVNGYRSDRIPLDFEIASTGFSWKTLWRFGELAAKADVIHYHFPWPFMDMAHFITRAGKPTLVTYHSDIIRQRLLRALYSPLCSRFLSSVSHVVATSPNYLATSPVLRKLGAKVSVIPIGIERSTYPVPEPAAVRRWREQVGERFFLFTGVFRYYKGLHVLLDAAVGTDFPIVLIGVGPIEAELKAQAARLGLSNIHFVGHVSDADKVALLSLCHGVVFPSHLRSEAFGISLLEGAMFGKPMISSEIGTGTTFVNIGGETGLVVPPSDPAALREAMRRLWTNPLEAAEMGERAAARYERLFTGDRMVAAYAGLYRRLAGEREAAA
ncbi:MAG: glycosyltransferase family 4 protein [Alphaproteobacteria bacterium]|nr:glycosyltransferase family 4 protein [Alphaproteobacteria bacterium]